MARLGVDDSPAAMAASVQEPYSVQELYMRRSMRPGPACPACAWSIGSSSLEPTSQAARAGPIASRRLGDGEVTARRKANGRRTDGREAGASQGEIGHGGSHSFSTARRLSIRVTAPKARQAEAIRQAGAGFGEGQAG